MTRQSHSGSSQDVLRRDSGTIRDFRNHSVEQGFGGSSSVLNCPHKAKLPFLMANRTDAPCNQKRLSWRKPLIADTTEEI